MSYNAKLATILISIMAIIIFLFFRKQPDPGYGNSINRNNIAVSVTNNDVTDSIKNNYTTLKVHIENFSGRTIYKVCIKGYLYKISADSPKYSGGTDIISFSIPCNIENENTADLFTSINSLMTSEEEFRIVDICIHDEDRMCTTSSTGIPGYYKVRAITGLSRGITHMF